MKKHDEMMYGMISDKCWRTTEARQQLRFLQEDEHHTAYEVELHLWCSWWWRMHASSVLQPVHQWGAAFMNPIHFSWQGRQIKILKIDVAQFCYSLPATSVLIEDSLDVDILSKYIQNLRPSCIEHSASKHATFHCTNKVDQVWKLMFVAQYMQG
jgi:hypothetical protein